MPPEPPAIKRKGQCLSGQSYLDQLPDVPVGTPSARHRFVQFTTIRAVRSSANPSILRSRKEGDSPQTGAKLTQ